MNILFQDNYFEEETSIWKARGATIIHGLCYEKYIKEFSPVIPRGTIAFHNTTKSALKYMGYPDIIWPFYNDWRVYTYSFLGTCQNILNWDKEVYCCPPERGQMLEKFKEGSKWIRCNSGKKQFSGGVYTLDELIAEWGNSSMNEPEDTEYAIASPKTIGREWRIVIIENEIQSSSQYMNKGEPETLSYTKTPENVLKFAEEWRKSHLFWSIPPSYVLDVCEHEGDLKIVEINNLLTSGWYECDIEKIVDKIISTVKNL